MTQVPSNSSANTEELFVGDIIHLYGSGGRYLYDYKIDKVNLSGNKRIYLAFLDNGNGKWSANHSQFDDSSHYTWIKRGSTNPCADIPLTTKENIAPTGGCVCKKCNSGNPFAGPNQKDGTYICYECR